LAVKVVVGKKGCIIIPKSIRELVGIKEGDVLTLTVENGRIVLEPERKLASSPP
jgi:AbrB family looped-hinge helix DNA binding protein